MTDLVLAVNREYFEQIKSGEKLEEYRLCNAYWHKRLEGKTFTNVVITQGYPPAHCAERRLAFPFMGWTRKQITHKHFGSAPVEVYAIRLEKS